MGYTTDFDGSFSIEPALSDKDRDFLIAYSDTRHLKRVGLDKKYGLDGEWFTKGDPETEGGNVEDINRTPISLPGLWCQWVPNEEGTEYLWDEGEKAYNMEDWIYYLVEFFFKPRGYTLNGTVDAQGEEGGDVWSIHIKDNNIKYDGITGSYEEYIPKIRAIREAKQEDLPKYLSEITEIKENSWFGDPGTRWYLQEIKKRIDKDLEGH
jgi:hypothetical protein